jgi:hypothetical protein
MDRWIGGEEVRGAFQARTSPSWRESGLCHFAKVRWPNKRRLDFIETRFQSSAFNQFICVAKLRSERRRRKRRKLVEMQIREARG